MLEEVVTSLSRRTGTAAHLDEEHLCERGGDCIHLGRQHEGIRQLLELDRGGGNGDDQIISHHQCLPKDRRTLRPCVDHYMIVIVLHCFDSSCQVRHFPAHHSDRGGPIHGQ